MVQRPAKARQPLHERDVVAGVSDVQRCRHPRDAAPDYQGASDWLDCLLAHRLGEPRAGDSQADQLLGLPRRPRRVIHVRPRTVFSDVGHLDQVWVQAGFASDALEERLVCPVAASRHEHPVQPILRDRLADLRLTILETSVVQRLCVCDAGLSRGESRHVFGVDDARDARIAAADEGPDTWFLAAHIALGRQFARPREERILPAVGPRADLAG